MPFVPLTSQPLVFAEQDWGTPQVDRSVQGHPIRLAGKSYAGIGTHANSDLIYSIGGRFTRFRATVGIDDEMSDYAPSSIDFTVVGDGKTLWTSGLIKHGVAPKRFDLDVTGVQALELKVGDGGDGIGGDHADWADALLTPAPSSPTTGQAAYAGRNFSLTFDKTGTISQVKFKNGPWLPVAAETFLAGSQVVKEPKVEENGGEAVVRQELKLGQTVLSQLDRFSFENGAIKWRTEISSRGPLVTAPLVTLLDWPGAKLWAAWNDPIGAGNDVWHDPLEPQPITGRSWSYGETTGGDWTTGDLVTLPMFTLFGPGQSPALTYIQSPEDPLPEARLASSTTGVAFSRNHLRFGGGKTYAFTGYLIPHRPDVRAALGQISKKFPAYFNPPVSSTARLGGCAAYSGDERVLAPEQVQSLNRMAFSTMWKLSDDYVYMGMFLPPTRDVNEPWIRTPDSGSPAGYKPLQTDVQNLNGYGRMLKGDGFHLLNYFNACEFGVNLKPVKAATASEDWKNASLYLANHFPNAPLRDATGVPLPAWQGGWVMDPGDPQYRDHLLEQARLHLERIPDSDGICIDRADYLRLHNSNADDGISWYGGPARSLVFSYQRLTQDLGSMLRPHNKAIFANLMDPRLDLTRHLDGLYCEFGDVPTVLNGASFLCLKKPLLTWTRDDTALSDAYFQRELYLGAFPTAPYPTNNHCIEPSPEHDRWYLDYGPLFAALKGRSWVLDGPTVTAQGAKVNLFKTERGHVAVVAFATTNRVRLKGISASSVTVLQPGLAPLRVVVRDGEVEVPAARGCAVVRF